MRVPSLPRSLLLLLLALVVPHASPAQPTPEAQARFDAYSLQIESRLAAAHRDPDAYIALPRDPAALSRLRSGQPLIERLTPPAPEFAGAMLHHWRGTAFVPGAHAADLDRLLRDFPSYPRRFAPQVLTATAHPAGPDHTLATLRVQQHHVLTVVLDTSYDVRFSALDLTHRSSTSRLTHVAELAAPNTPAEHPLPPQEDHGFLCGMNTYWSFEERDGGLYLQLETVSLTRGIPRGLAWAIHGYIDSIPRESLEFTLTHATQALPR